MTEENDKVVIADEDTKEDDFSEEELADDATDWKAKAAELKGIAKRRATQLAKVKAKLAEVKVEPKQSPKPDKPEFKDFDDGQYAYLTAKQIEDDGEIAIVKEAVKESGKSLRDVLKLKYVQEELKEYREAKTTKEATPSGSNRSGTSASTQVDYWLNKGELPPATPENRQLRIDVVNAKLKRQSNANQFTDNPIGNVAG